MKCADCMYCWQDENDDFPRCHYEGEWEAPCELDDDYKEDEEE